MIEVTKVGAIGRAFGKEGFLKLYLEDGFENKVNTGDFLFIYLKGAKVPYRIIDLKEQHDHHLVKFHQYLQSNSTHLFTNKDCYAYGIKANDTVNIPDFAYKDFKVKLSNDQEIGTFLKIEEHASHFLAIVETPKGVIRIPYHSDLILSLDEKQGIIKFDFEEDILNL